MPTELKIKMEPLVFHDYIAPKGFLSRDNESHALWYYYVCANKARIHQKEDFRLETQFKPSEHDYTGLIKGIAKLYNVTPEGMVKCWHQVDLQCRVLDLPLLPDKFRHPTMAKRIILSTSKGDLH